MWTFVWAQVSFESLCILGLWLTSMHAGTPGPGYTKLCHQDFNIPTDRAAMTAFKAHSIPVSVSRMLAARSFGGQYKHTRSALPQTRSLAPYQRRRQRDLCTQASFTVPQILPAKTHWGVFGFLSLAGALGLWWLALSALLSFSASSALRTNFARRRCVGANPACDDERSWSIHSTAERSMPMQYTLDWWEIHWQNE